jgi:hypothetical protein
MRSYIDVVQMMKYSELNLFTVSAFGSFSLSSMLTFFVQRESCASDLISSFVLKSCIMYSYHAYQPWVVLQYHKYHTVSSCLLCLARDDNKNPHFKPLLSSCLLRPEEEIIESISKARVMKIEKRSGLVDCIS